MELRFRALGWAHVVLGVLGVILTLFLSSRIQQLFGLIRGSGFPGPSELGGPPLGYSTSAYAGSVGLVMILTVLAVILSALAVSRGFSILTRVLIAAVLAIVIILVADSIGPIGTLVVLLTLAVAVLMVVNGFGILTRRPWAQPLTVALSVLLLFAKPVGTVIGAFGLWVMVLPVVTTPWDHYTGNVRGETASRLRNSPEE